MHDSLESLALQLGMLVASSLLEDEVARLCGRRHERQPHRTHTRYGHQRGTATLAGQKIAIARPRVRRTDGGGEVPLETYARLQSPEAAPGRASPHGPRREHAGLCKCYRPHARRLRSPEIECQPRLRPGLRRTG